MSVYITARASYQQALPQASLQDSRPTNGLAVLCRSSPAATYPPLSVDRHVPDTGGHSLVLARLEYGNSVLAGLPTYLVRRLQSVMNAAARLIYHLRRSGHISDALVCLHWLHVPERIQFKIAVLTYKVLHGHAPGYLGPFTRVADLPSRRSLRSISTNRLTVPPTRMSTVGSRAFPVVGPQTWNNLTEDVTSADSLPTFRRLLKTHLFRKSFLDCMLDIN